MRTKKQAKTKLTKEEKQLRWMARWEKKREKKWKYMIVEGVKFGLMLAVIFTITDTLFIPDDDFSFKKILVYFIVGPIVSIFIWAPMQYHTKQRAYKRTKEWIEME